MFLYQCTCCNNPVFATSVLRLSEWSFGSNRTRIKAEDIVCQCGGGQVRRMIGSRQRLVAGARIVTLADRRVPRYSFPLHLCLASAASLHLLQQSPRGSLLTAILHTATTMDAQPWKASRAASAGGHANATFGCRVRGSISSRRIRLKQYLAYLKLFKVEIWTFCVNS